jgi:hypothetical protein
LCIGIHRDSGEPDRDQQRPAETTRDLNHSAPRPR